MGHALVIGTGTDTNGQLSPKFQSTINDAEWIADVLKNPSLCAYPEDNVKLLTGKCATLEHIISELDAIKKKTSAVAGEANRGTVVVFFSGHGQKNEDESETYLLPYGFNADDDLDTHAINGDILFQKLGAMDAKRILLLLNSCWSGSVMPQLGKKPSMPLSPRQINTLLKGEGFAYLSAAQPSQKAETGYVARQSSKRYSPFTLGLARGFSGKGKKNDDENTVRFSDLTTACVAYVTEKTKSRQLPHFDFKGDNFVVGYYKTGAADGYPLLGDDEVKVDVDEDVVEDEDKSKSKILPGTASIKVSGNSYNNVKGPIFAGIGSIGNNANFSYNNRY